MNFASKKAAAASRPFLAEAMERMLDDEGRARAHAVFEGAAAQIPEFMRYRMTPQTPPYHAEGATLAAHVERVLAAVLAIEEGASVLDIEEFARETVLRHAFLDLEATIRTHAAFWKVFALVHDIAKPDRVVFTADPALRGAAEGFAARGGEHPPASPQTLARYDKLVRAFAAAHPRLAPDALAGAFFDAYGIRAHYDDHDRKGAGPEYAGVRAAALALFGVDPAFHKLLAEVIWGHIDALGYFQGGADAVKYAALAARGRKVGLNADVYLTYAAAAMLLDTALGSTGYDRGRAMALAMPLVNMLRAEQEAMPLRNATRLAALERGRKLAVREVLDAAKLAPEQVFALVPAPLGPVRGEIMRGVTSLIRGHDSEFAFGRALPELSARAAQARDLLRERGLYL